jgi:hypothetical protein
MSSCRRPHNRTDRRPDRHNSARGHVDLAGEHNSSSLYQTLKEAVRHLQMIRAVTRSISIHGQSRIRCAGISSALPQIANSRRCLSDSRISAAAHRSPRWVSLSTRAAVSPQTLPFVAPKPSSILLLAHRPRYARATSGLRDSHSATAEERDRSSSILSRSTPTWLSITFLREPSVFSTLLLCCPTNRAAASISPAVSICFSRQTIA